MDYYQDQEFQHGGVIGNQDDGGLSEITNAPMPSKRMPTSATQRAVEMVTSRGTDSPIEESDAPFPIPRPRPRAGQAISQEQLQRSVQPEISDEKRDQLMSRWYRLVGEMQCLMSEMQTLGMSPPPFSFGSQPAPQVQVQPKPAMSPISPTQPSWEMPAGRSTPPSQSPVEIPQPSRRQTATGRQNQSSPNNLDIAPFVALVEFKRQRIRRYEATLFVKPGEYVVVDGDRGTDCGFVVQCAVRNTDGTYGRTESIDNTPIDPSKVKSETGRIHRVATQQEVALLHGDIASMERYALKTCRERVSGMGLKMEIVDCEFQFDRKKVTFFFDSQESIDFRELTKDLYRVFGSRIWLENINSKVKNVVPDGALSHADKVLYAQRGLRAPRR